MLDFQELPTNGTKFEQLVRELMLKKGLRPFWTGVGPDYGCDLVVEEELSGSIKNSCRLWLVDCKHNAASGRSVGINDVIDIRDRCDRISATGFCLHALTVSSELSRKLNKIENNTGILTEVWDAVTIEKLLLKARCGLIFVNDNIQRAEVRIVVHCCLVLYLLIIASTFYLKDNQPRRVSM